MRDYRFGGDPFFCPDVPFDDFADLCEEDYDSFLEEDDEYFGDEDFVGDDFIHCCKFQPEEEGA